MNKKTLIGILVTLLVPASFACTTVIVGKDASTTGQIMFGRNSDTKSPARAKHLKIYPETASSARFIALPYYDTESRDGMLQVAMNQHGVAISATETITSNKTALQFDPFVESGLGEFDLVKPIIGQAKTAQEAVDILGGIITSRGVSEGFGVVLADANEAWYLETGSGHHWVAVKIPDDAYFVSSNQGRIQQIGLQDGKFESGFKGSPDVISFAVEHKFAQYSDHQFDFRKTYQRIINRQTGNLENDISYNYYRIATLQNLYSQRSISGFESGEFPTFLKPVRKLSLQDVESGLENYFQGTTYNPYLTESTVYRAISVFRSSNSHITVMTNNPESSLAVVEYIALGMPSSSIYIPFYVGMTRVPDGYAVGNDKADDQSAFWRFRKLQTLVLLDFAHNQPIVRAAFDNLQQKINLQQVAMEKKYTKTHNAQLIDQFTAKVVKEALELNDSLRSQLEDHYNHTNSVHLKFNNADYDKLTAEMYQKYPFKGF